MKIKSNTPLSDNELRRVKDAFDEENPDAALFNMFPHTHHRIEGDTIFFGCPPWDLTQEITL